MRAPCRIGVDALRVETVRDPEIVDPRECVLRVTMPTTCGSDLTGWPTCSGAPSCFNCKTDGCVRVVFTP